MRLLIVEPEPFWEHFEVSSLANFFERFFKTLASAWGQGFAIASLFGKPGAVFSQEPELSVISLAPNANTKMKANEQARTKGQAALHGLRKEPGHVVAMGSGICHKLHDFFR
jgi:hypothetical protein